jgi:peptide/nickel transport system substrate-binding protein
VEDRVTVAPVAVHAVPLALVHRTDVHRAVVYRAVVHRVAMRRAAMSALAICAGMLASTTAVRAETRPRYGGSIEATLLGAPATLDPVAARTHAETTVAMLVFDTLFRVGADGSAQPHLVASEPTLDEKRTTVYVPIRKGIRLHDGSELTAADVALSLERARKARWLVPTLLAAKADGDGVVLTLRAPTPDLVAQLAQPQTSITKGGRAPGERAIGSGPYVVEAFDRARRRLALRAFDEHFAGRPYVDALALTWYDSPDGEARRFETGKSQVSMRGATAFAAGKPTYRSADLDGPAAVLAFVGFGRAHEPITADRAFRRALDLALARGGLAAITRGERVIPPRSPAPVEAGGGTLDARGRASDTDAARTQLADAQRRVPALAPARLRTLQLEILVDDTRPDDRELGERVVLALDKLGIQALITPVPAATLRDRVAKGSCDLWIGQLVHPVTAAHAWWASAFATGGDDWPLSQLQLGNLDTAAAAREFAARMPIVPLMFRSVRLWHPTNLRGITFDASGRPTYADLFVFGAPTPNQARP